MQSALLETDRAKLKKINVKLEVEKSEHSIVTKIILVKLNIFYSI